MGAGQLIAIQVALLYIVLGPLVLLAIYVLFDVLARPKGPGHNQQARQANQADAEDPALWTDEDLNDHLSRL